MKHHRSFISSQEQVFLYKHCKSRGIPGEEIFLHEGLREYVFLNDRYEEENDYAEKEDIIREIRIYL